MNTASQEITATKALRHKDFGELVRERRRRWGLALPPAEKILPFRSALAPPDGSDDVASALALDVEPPESASDQERVQWRASLAERRLREAEQACERAMGQGKPARQLARLRADVERETATYAAALDCLATAGGAGPPYHDASLSRF